MIRQNTLLWNLVLISLLSFAACKDASQANFPVENGETSGKNPASPVLLMLSEMMNKDAKSTSLKELQKQIESDRTHIQKIPRRNQEKLDLEQKKKELEEKERELEGNFVLTPEFNKYAYKNVKPEPSITYTIDSVCQLVTCYKDGKPFMNIHSYCYNGIFDLQAACEERFFSARYRRAGEGNAAHHIPLSYDTSDDPCTPGLKWKVNCNECYCAAQLRQPVCTQMKCPPKDLPATKSRRDVFGPFKTYLTDEQPADSSNPDSSNRLS